MAHWVACSVLLRFLLLAKLLLRVKALFPDVGSWSMDLLGNPISSKVIIFCLKFMIIPNWFRVLVPNMRYWLAHSFPIVFNNIRCYSFYPFAVAIFREFNLNTILPFCLKKPTQRVPWLWNLPSQVLCWHLSDLKSNYQMLDSSKTGFTRVLLFFTSFYSGKTIICQSNLSPEAVNVFLLYQM